MAFAVTLGWAAAVASPPPRLELRVRDAKSGREVRFAEAALARPGSTAVYARLRGAAWSGDAVPRPGDTLWVYRRGYDVHAAVLGAEDLRDAVAGDGLVLTAALTPAEGRVHVRLLGEGAAEAAATLHVLVAAPGRWSEPPFRDSLEIGLVDGQARFGVPDGADVSCLVVAAPGIAWPHVVGLAAGQRVDLRYEPPRRVRVLVSDPPPRLEPGRVECVPDLLWKPAAEPARIDAWRRRLNGPGWLREGLVGGRAVLEVTPDVPFHLLAVIGTRPVYRYVAPGADALDLRGPFYLRTVAARPVVDGQPVREGTWLAPGRLDLAAIATLAELASSLAGCAIRVGAANEPWPEPRLPDSPVLTAWHRETGIAHLTWGRDGAPAGRTAPGRLRLESPSGCRVAGHVSLYPVWKGAGTVRTAPPDAMLRRAVDGPGPFHVRGLVPGRYGLDVHVTVTPARGGRTRRVRRMLELTVPEAAPSVRFRIPEK